MTFDISIPPVPRHMLKNSRPPPHNFTKWGGLTVSWKQEKAYHTSHKSGMLHYRRKNSTARTKRKCILLLSSSSPAGTFVVIQSYKSPFALNKRKSVSSVKQQTVCVLCYTVFVDPAISRPYTLHFQISFCLTYSHTLVENGAVQSNDRLKQTTPPRPNSQYHLPQPSRL